MPPIRQNAGSATVGSGVTATMVQPFLPAVNPDAADNLSSVPEPATLLLVLLRILGVVGRKSAVQFRTRRAA